MKKTKTTIKVFAFTSVLLCSILTSCQDAGVTWKKLTGEEQNLPDELKGLKVYWVSTGHGDGINVAVLN